MKPCDCGNYVDGSFDPAKHCKKCYLWAHSEEYRKQIENGPSIIRRAANFATAVARHVSAGLPSVDAETKRIRLETCNACEFFVNQECKKCGCSLMAKTSWALEHCPINKW